MRFIGLLVFSAVVFALLWFALALYPSNVFEDQDGCQHAVADFFASKGAMGFIALAALFCALTVFWQRRQPDRYSPIIVLSMAVGLLGGMAEISSLSSVANCGQHDWNDLIGVSIGVLTASAALAFLGLVWLIAKRSPQRGRLIALGVLVWAGCNAFAQEAWIRRSHGMTMPENGIELASVAGLAYIPEDAFGSRRERTKILFVDIDAEGGISIEGEALPRGNDDALRTGLATLLATSEEPAGSDFLWIRIDAHTPFAAVARLREQCSSSSITVQGHRYLVELQSANHPGWKIGCMTVALVGAADSDYERDLASPENRSIELHRSEPDESPEYRFRQTTTHDLDTLLEALNASEVPRSPGLILRASPTIEWHELAVVIDHLMTGDRYFDSLELLD